MNRVKDIGRILTKGSAKQRALLYFSSTLEKAHGEKGFLSEAEEKQIFDSFKTDSEIRLYNKFNRARLLVYNKLMVLKQVEFQYRETAAHLRGFCLVYIALEQTRDTLQDIYTSAGSKEEKERLLKIIDTHKSYLWADVSAGDNPDRDGIQLNPKRRLDHKTGKEKAPEGKEPQLRDILRVFSERAKAQLIEGKTRVKAIRDYIEESGFDIRVLNDAIDLVDQDFREDKAPLPKFSKKQMERHLNLESPKRKTRLEAIFGKNWLFPDYEEVAIDEELYKKDREDEGA